MRNSFLRFNLRISVIIFSFLFVGQQAFCEKVNERKIEENILNSIEDSSVPLVSSVTEGPYTFDLISGQTVRAGGVLVLRVTNKNNFKYNALAKINGNECKFFSPKNELNEATQFCFVGVPINQKPGRIDIAFTVLSSEQNQTDAKLTVLVQESNETKKIEFLDLVEEKVRPGEINIVKRVAQEEAELNDMLMTYSPLRYWDNKFDVPVIGKISSSFGVNRIYNDNPQRRTHWGIDIPVPRGAKIITAAPGKVLVAKSFYFLGKSVVVDHGLGLVTLYGHLDRLKVKPGQILKQGQVIGTGGKSGKATGNTLHFQVVVGKVKVDPSSFLQVALKDIASVMNKDQKL